MHLCSILQQRLLMIPMVMVTQIQLLARILHHGGLEELLELPPVWSRKPSLQVTSSFLPSLFQFPISSFILSFTIQLPTSTDPYVCCCQGRARSPRLFRLSHKPRQQPYFLLLHGRLPGYYFCLCRQIFCVRVPPEYGCFRRRSCAR